MTVELLFLLATAVSRNPPTDVIDKPRFVELMKALHARPTTVSFVAEGYVETFSLAGKPRPPGPFKYQALYVLRKGEPSAGLLEYYLSDGDKPPVRHSVASVNLTLDMTDHPVPLTWNPKTKRRELPKGGILAMSNPFSPQNWYFEPYFSGYRKVVLSNFFYEFLGWENIDSHLCLKVALAEGFHESNPVDKQILWIDIERGGHPLKSERIYKNRRVATMDSVVLRKFDVPGGPYWLPISCRREFYGDILEPSDEVTGRASHSIVTTSVKFDEQLPDSTFVVHTKPRTPHPTLTSLAANFPKAVTPTRPEFRADPGSMAKRLDADLAKAAEQRRELEASAPSRDPFQQPWIWQGAAAVCVFASLIALAVHRRRGAARP